jgi:hypothetical protein
MKWVPKSPIKSFVPKRLNVLDYRTTWKFDFIVCEFVMDNGRRVEIEGFDSFKQKVVKFVLTDKKRFSYGLMNDIFNVETQERFDIEAEKLANDLVSQVLSDSTSASPNGLGHTVEEIECIETIQKDGHKFLLITMKATGVSGSLIVEVPFPTF